MKVELTGRVALVTGAARGIGKSIADLYADNGAQVIYGDICYRTAAPSAPLPAGCRAMALDVTSEDEVNQVIETIIRDFGRLDIVVNNAGINTLHHRVTVDEFPREEWDRLLDVDLNGLFLVSRRASRAMLDQGAGRIINISSVVGLVPLRRQCAFAAAKAAVINLTRAMALELAPRGVLVNAIAPGSILTDVTRDLFYGPDGQFKSSAQQLMDHIPLGRPGTTEEIAHAALFLAAPESSYINGHVLTVDGGWTAGYMRDF